MFLWHLATGERTKLGAPADATTAVSWSPDGTHVATTGSAGAVVVERVDSTSRTGVQLAGANCVTWVGTTIVVGQRNGLAVLELREAGA